MRFPLNISRSLRLASSSQTAQDVCIANVQTLFTSLSSRGHAHVSELAEEPIDDVAETRSPPESSVSHDEPRQAGEKQVPAVVQKEAIEPENGTHAEEKQNRASHQIGNGSTVSFE